MNTEQSKCHTNAGFHCCSSVVVDDDQIHHVGRDLLKNKHVRSSCAYAYVAVVPSEDNIRKTSVFVLFMLRAYVYGYAYALVKTSLFAIVLSC